VEQAVGVEVLEIARIPVHGLLERPVEKTDVPEGKRPDGDRDLRLDSIRDRESVAAAGDEESSQPKEATPD
jgi:hypothetical protein